ncbi:hypothetical protein FRC09_011780 [Ceratobasidium sp. 395]|nr:hypothetical protein FRC09_011780 [Ceratobasidium sp. 395]
MNRFNSDRIAHTLDTITPADLRKAADEESRGEIASNPAIQVLKKSITATSRRVMASGPSRTQLRSQIQSAAIYFNQPTIWLTINPDDLHDPIAQILAGEEIDMDNFIRTAGPDNTRRAQNIAQDPYAAANYIGTREPVRHYNLTNPSAHVTGRSRKSEGVLWNSGMPGTGHAPSPHASLAA